MLASFLQPVVLEFSPVQVRPAASQQFCHPLQRIFAPALPLCSPSTLPPSDSHFSSVWLLGVGCRLLVTGYCLLFVVCCGGGGGSGRGGGGGGGGGGGRGRGRSWSWYGRSVTEACLSRPRWWLWWSWWLWLLWLFLPPKRENATPAQRRRDVSSMGSRYLLLLLLVGGAAFTYLSEWRRFLPPVLGWQCVSRVCPLLPVRVVLLSVAFFLSGAACSVPFLCVVLLSPSFLWSGGALTSSSV